MSELIMSTGNKAVAAAVKMAKPLVVAAYPITPQTEIIESIADYVESGELKARYIPVEVGTLGNDRLYRRLHHRSACVHCDKLAWSSLHA